MDYSSKHILAPMVRCGSLSFRLLCLEYGADIVFAEEVIDLKMINCKRTINETFNTIEYCVDGYKKPVFQTCAKEKGKLVFQLGTCNPERALAVCKLIEDDVDGIDINMGCPKEFSVQGGMGAALLKNPELVEKILTTLVNGCSKPITCKIRCLPSLEDTIELCKRIEKCGVKALTVHGRFQHERSRNPNHDDYIKEIAKVMTIPVIANGGSNVIKEYADIEKFKISCGVSSVMLARAAMWDCSRFRKEGRLPLDVVMKRFLKISLETNNFFFNTKYVIQQMLHEELQTERGIAVLASLCEEELYKLFDMLEDLAVIQKHALSLIDQQVFIYKDEEHLKNNDCRECPNSDDSAAKRLKTYNGDIGQVEQKSIISMHAKYAKKDYRDGNETPKSILHTWTLDNSIPRPIYTTEQKMPERTFKSMVEVQGIKYTTPYWEVNKQMTEQSAAIVCLEMLKIEYKNKFKNK